MLENSYTPKTLDVHFIDRILEVLEQSALEAKKESSINFYKEPKTYLVFLWLKEFAPFWEKHSKVILSEGKEYDGPAMRILENIARPLKFHSLSIIAQAIKLYRKDKPFLQKTGSMFQ